MSCSQASRPATASIEKAATPATMSMRTWGRGGCINSQAGWFSGRMVNVRNLFIAGVLSGPLPSAFPLLRTRGARVADGGDFRAARSVGRLHLIRKRFGQAKLPARDHINAHGIAEAGHFQPEFGIEGRGLRLLSLQLFELKAEL